MSDQSTSPCYKFTVRSASEAAELIRERLGAKARVLSVRTVESTGISRFWTAPRLEVIAQLEPSVGALPEPDDTETAPTTNLRTRMRFEAPRTDLRTLLLRAGFSETLLTRLTQSPDWAELTKLPLHRGLIETGRQLHSLAESNVSGGLLNRAAFIGLAGAGRTTALCKWLSIETFRRGRSGHVVMAEFDRPNPPGALPVYCEALGVPVAHFPALTKPVTPEGFVYFDLPGHSLRDPAANEPVRSFLEQEAITQRVLVLNAAYDPVVFRQACATGINLGATHVIFTHLDEVTRWGRLWDYVLDSGLEPLLLTTGPSLTGDCEDDVLDALVRRTLPVMDEPETTPQLLGSAA